MANISIENFNAVTKHIGMVAKDTGTVPNTLDAKDDIRLNGQGISYETAVETYFKMQSAPPVEEAPPPPPPVTIRRTLEVGRAMLPNRLIREIRVWAFKWPSLDIRVEDLGGFLTKDIAISIKGPENIAKNFAKQFDRYIQRLAAS